MAENMIKFLRGNVASLPQTATAGAVYFTKDEGLYLGLADGTYHRYGDFIEVANVDALPVAGAHVKAMYYCTAENILAKWNGTKWVQINKQQTLAELGGVAKSVYDAKMAALEKADTDNATAISGVDTRLQAAEEKLKSVATTEGLGQLTRTVEGHTASIDTIMGDVNTEGSMLKIAKTAADGKDAAIKEAKDAADAAQGTVDTLVQTHATDKAALEAAIGANTTAAGAAKTRADDAYALAESKATMDEVNAAIEGAGHAVASEVEAAIDEINDLIGDTKGKTVVEMIADAQSTATYDDEEVRGLIGDNADAIAQEVTDRGNAITGLKNELEGQIDNKVDQSVYDEKVGKLEDKDEELAGLIGENAAAIGELGTEIDNLVGEDTGKTIRTIANEELAAQLIGDDAKDSLDTLKEIADWIQSHPDDASAMNTAIEALQAKVDTGDNVTVSAYVTAAINALKIGDYATVAALNEAVGRIAALETASATHATQTALQGVADALDQYKTAHNGDYDNAAIDAKVKGVQDQIDALDDVYATDAELTGAINAEVERANGAYAAKTLESTVDTHVKDTAAHVSAEDRAKWNGAQAAAEATAAANLATARNEITAEIATAKGQAIADAEGKIATALETAKTDASNKDAVVLAEAQKATADAKSELQGKIDTVSGALNTYKTENNNAVALKANAADVYTKSEVEAMLTWGEFGA